VARNKELNEKMKDERRQIIRQHALRLFATKGLAATKITDIANASGMAQGLMYHYYASKDDIFVELIEHAFEQMNSAVLALEQLDLPPHDKIKLALENLIDGLDDHADTGYYHLLIAQATASDTIPERAKNIIKEQSYIPYEVMARIIAQGQDDGSIKKFDPHELALVFWTSVKGLAIHKATHGANFRSPDFEILLNMFV
jgi:AcrR family transcriptional regulator